MTQRSFQVEPDLWNAARLKAGVFGSVSEVIRKLLRLWVEGKIKLEEYED